MTHRLYRYLFLITLVFLSACNKVADSEEILLKCTHLAEEVKEYGRANYLKLFHTINPEKFSATYQKVSHFDNAPHRAMINTYVKALARLKTQDEDAKRLIQAATDIATFVTNFVDHDYDEAVHHKKRSRNNPKSDKFFLEINEIVKFDYDVTGFDKQKETFKGLLENYEEALAVYSNKIKTN